MDSLLALLIILVVYSVGDMVSYKTKSKIPMMFVGSMFFLVAFWLGLPKTIFEDAQLVGFGRLMIALLITHMGTMLSFEDLKAQWKTVIIAVSAVAGIGIFLFIVGSPILGKEYAIASAPPIAGGTVAVVIMSEAAKARGLESIGVFVTLVVVMQGYFGYPIASYMLNKEAKVIVKNFKENPGFISSPVGAGAGVGIASANGIKLEKKKLIKELPKELQTPYILLAKLAVTAFVSTKLAGLTNGIIHPYVMCLIVGVVATEVGFLETHIMNKANSFGLAMLALMGVVLGNLSSATPQMILSLLFPILTSLTLGVIGIIIFSSIAGKLLGYSFEMAIAIGTSALFGFPGTFILSNEVANANSDNEEEREAILNHILPKMLVAGFVTVTIASVLLAGFMAKLI